jgi:hypothetical protein
MAIGHYCLPAAAMSALSGSLAVKILSLAASAGLAWEAQEVLNRFCSKKLYDDPLTTEMIVNVFIGLGSIGLSLLKAAKAGGSLATPKVTDPDLENLVDDLYKGAKGPNSIGTGSTADAVRNELQTGLPTHGRFHSQKAQEYSTALNKWLKKNPNASDYDKMVARSILNDLQSALEGD